MSVNLNKHKNDLLFIPLGGTNEIGINVNLFHLDGKWIMVDCGAGFADDHLPGVDVIVADVSFIEKHKKDLLGLIITHAHEDHLGAVQYLHDELECPIYTTKFTANFLKTKLSEYDSSKKVKINIVEPNSTLDLEPFKIEFIGLTHSAPEMQALAIQTKAGVILHTGDWKFDPNPLVGPESNYDALKKYGDQGVLALTCDSTNVFNPGSSGSEGDLKESLYDIISGCQKMVIVTTFASNLARIDSLINIAKKLDRKVVLAGRSMHRMVNTAQDSGYLQEVDNIIDEQALGKYDRSKIMVLATGCQGEPMAAIAKVASNNHQSIKLTQGDTIIFSSKIIPGNEKKIGRMLNNFVQHKVNVITEQDHFVHVSGHPGREELKKMYDLVRPKICVPVHGEPIHIHAQAELARSHGIKKCLELENGDVAILNEDNPEIIGKVENGYLAVEGKHLLPTTSNIFKARRRMRDSGVGVVTIILDSNKKRIAAKPIISLPGFLDSDLDKELLGDITVELHEMICQIMNGKNSKRSSLEESVKSHLRRMLKTEIGKAPFIVVNVVSV